MKRTAKELSDSLTREEIVAQIAKSQAVIEKHKARIQVYHDALKRKSTVDDSIF